MLRREKIINCFDARESLTLDHPVYKQYSQEIFRSYLEQDLGKGDVSQYPRELYARKITAKIIAKSAGVAAGLRESIYLLQLRHIIGHSDHIDGDHIKPGEILLTLTGEIGAIMAVERTILNILQRFCGIASLTAEYVRQLRCDCCFIIGTRKTLWSYWDKRALQSGGGLSHRLSLDDAIMLKDNHLRLIKSAEPYLLKDIISELGHRNPDLRFIEVEVSTENEFWQILEVYATLQTSLPKVIMFDHFGADKINQLIEEIKSQEIYDQVLFEASGNITQKQITEYSLSGVDVISCGALTHSAIGLDLSLSIEEKAIGTPDI